MQPVISVDTKKKELIGLFTNRGKTWRPAGDPVRTNVHAFPDPALGKANPYGIYDIAANDGWCYEARCLTMAASPWVTMGLAGLVVMVTWRSSTLAGVCE